MKVLKSNTQHTGNLSHRSLETLSISPTDGEQTSAEGAYASVANIQRPGNGHRQREQYCLLCSLIYCVLFWHFLDAKPGTATTVFYLDKPSVADVCLSWKESTV